MRVCGPRHEFQYGPVSPERFVITALRRIKVSEGILGEGKFSVQFSGDLKLPLRFLIVVLI